MTPQDKNAQSVSLTNFANLIVLKTAVLVPLQKSASKVPIRGPKGYLWVSNFVSVVTPVPVELQRPVKTEKMRLVESFQVFF